MGGAVYAVSARGPDAVTSHPERYSYQLRMVVDGGDPRAFAADGVAVCQEVQYLNMFQPLYCGANIQRGHSAPVMEGRGDGGDALRPMAESGNIYTG